MYMPDLRATFDAVRFTASLDELCISADANHNNLKVSQTGQRGNRTIPVIEGPSHALLSYQAKPDPQAPYCTPCSLQQDSIFPISYPSCTGHFSPMPRSIGVGVYITNPTSIAFSTQKLGSPPNNGIRHGTSQFFRRTDFAV